MPKYTTYIPKEFFFEGVASIQVLFAIIVILVLIFLAYKFYESSRSRRRPESF